jgi:hypothetical protein
VRCRRWLNSETNALLAQQRSGGMQQRIASQQLAIAGLHSGSPQQLAVTTQAVLPAEPCPVLLSADRLRSFDVYIGDTEPTSLATLASNTLCASVPGQASTDSVGFRVACTSVVPGRYLWCS